MEVATDFAPYQERVTSTLISTIKTAGQISAEDLNFQRSFDPELSKSLDAQSQRLLGLTNSVLKVATSSSDLNPPVLESEDSVEEKWRDVVDVVDELLEKADACLDEFTGIIKKLSPAENERGLKKADAAQFPSIYDSGRNRIAKPQLLFDRRPDNNGLAPFRPLLKSKPHAIVPLPESFQKDVGGDATQLYEHPYEVEISKAQYPASAYTSSTPQMYHPFESTTATFVDTFEGVKSMLAELKATNEIAVDLEHHDMHSYQGLVCLMQISTRDKDWIVDTLKPWREDLQILNEVFADPNILKVLHGSTMDIIWLQRDLGLYVVNLFDTYHAANALNYQKRSLKYLLEKLVNVQAEKRYQMADWRLRPLLPAMFDYARSDTHYLLYIYDQLRNELIQNSTSENNLIDHVLERSKEEALQRYERPIYDATTGKGAGGWYDALSRSSALFSREQFAVFRAVHQWRDEAARSDDEGVQFVLSKQSLFRVAHSMPLDPASLLKLASPVSSTLKSRASEVVKIIKEAKLSAATGPELHEVLRHPPAETEPLKEEKSDERPSPLASSAKAEVARAPISQFWGTTLQKDDNKVPTTYFPSASLDAMQLSLPLPSAPSQVSVVAAVADHQPPTKPDESTINESSPKHDSSGDIFTVKQFGAPKKRKSGLVDEPPASPSVEESEIRLTERPRNKKKKKTSTSGHGPSGQTTPSESQEQDGGDSSAFDYTTAKSVLHANSAENNPMIPSRQFNPYAKSLNAPSGMRKAKKDLGGSRSFTFRK